MLQKIFTNSPEAIILDELLKRGYLSLDMIRKTLDDHLIPYKVLTPLEKEGLITINDNGIELVRNDRTLGLLTFYHASLKETVPTF